MPPPSPALSVMSSDTALSPGSVAIDRTVCHRAREPFLEHISGRARTAVCVLLLTCAAMSRCACTTAR